MSLQTLPGANQVSKLFNSLLGRDVTVTKSKKTPLSKGTTVVAQYTNQQRTVTVFCLVDLKLAANLGSALVLVPASHAEGLVQSGKLDDAGEENVKEVCNVFGTLLEELVMDKFEVIDQPKKDLKSSIRTAQSRLDMQVNIRGYEGGRLTLAISKR